MLKIIFIFPLVKEDLKMNRWRTCETFSGKIYWQNICRYAVITSALILAEAFSFKTRAAPFSIEPESLSHKY